MMEDFFDTYKISKNKPPKISKWYKRYRYTYCHGDRIGKLEVWKIYCPFWVHVDFCSTKEAAIKMVNSLEKPIEPVKEIL